MRAPPSPTAVDDDNIDELRGRYNIVREERARLNRLQELTEMQQRLKERIEGLEGSSGGA